MESGRRKGKRKGRKIEQGWPRPRPVVGEGARGRNGPALPSPTPRAGDSEEAESRRGRPFIVIDVVGG